VKLAVCARGVLSAAASLKDAARLKESLARILPLAELQKNEPKPLKTGSRAQNRSPLRTTPGASRGTPSARRGRRLNGCCRLRFWWRAINSPTARVTRRFKRAEARRGLRRRLKQPAGSVSPGLSASGRFTRGKFYVKMFRTKKDCRARTKLVFRAARWNLKDG
jgi:hypothetical protein